MSWFFTQQNGRTGIMLNSALLMEG